MNAADLPGIWFAIVAFEVGLYVLLDGADLGIGVLSLFQKKEGARALMMQVIGPLWDANETWLIIAGGTLFGAFPLAYGIILSALYIPVMALIFGLIVRAASFEFHEYSTHKRFWSFLFGIGSLVAILGQGFMAGGLLSGIKVAGNAFAGGSFDWATPLSFAVVVLVLGGYVAIGYAYLVRTRAVSGLGERALYPAALAILGLSYAGLTMFMMPYIVPPSITIYEAASSAATLRFMLYGISPLIPLVLAYNFYLHRVFRDGRVSERDGHYGTY